jgi:hypothetical protein
MTRACSDGTEVAGGEGNKRRRPRPEVRMTSMMAAISTSPARLLLGERYSRLGGAPTVTGWLRGNFAPMAGRVGGGCGSTIRGEE